MQPGRAEPTASAPEFRILISEPAEWFRALIEALISTGDYSTTRIVFNAPETNQEDDLINAAARSGFDLAVLLLNTISYSSGNRDQLVEDSVAFVKRMATFRKPIVAFYGWPDDPDYPPRVLGAGATAVHRLPLKCEEIQRTFRRCISGR